MTRDEFIRGLRQLADLYESRPELDMPSYLPRWWIFTTEPEDFVRNVQAFGNGRKEFLKNDIEFHPDVVLPIAVNCRREKLCERKVVGSRHVPEKVIPAQVIPAHDEDVVEWDCKPVLAKARPAVELPSEKLIEPAA